MTSVKDSVLVCAQPIEEPTTDVNPKTLSKATKPPINIKSFFKRKEINSDDAVAVDASQKDVQDNDELTVINENRSVPKLNGARSSNDISALKNSTKLAGPKMAGTKGTASKRSRPGSSSLKRTISTESTGTKTKRQKQSSIFASLGRGSGDKTTSLGKGGGDNTTSQGRGGGANMTCPICGKTFEEGTSNANVNTHVDNCLIE